MEKFIKQYSYNQIIEQHDVLIMSLEQFAQNKNQLVNPKVIVCVDREGGVKKPKMPEWFKQWSENIYEKKQPAWFQQWTKEVYEKQPPKWFTDYMTEFAKKNNLKL
ncbi:MAG: hypothetical protein ACOQNV_00790 [Mycoplasmoidaceae bacterium]